MELQVVKERMPTLSAGKISAAKYNLNQKSTIGSKGFTLLELIVVLVIISLMMALVTPRLIGSLTKTNLKTSAQKISSFLRYARSQAVSEQTVYHAVFDFEKNSLYIKNEKPQDDEDTYFKAEIESAETDSSKSKRSGMESYILPEGVVIKKAIIANEEIDSDLFTIIFYPVGSSSGGSVVLMDEKERQYQINVDFITGIISLTEPDE
jgi:general secretion pathway protein H